MTSGITDYDTLALAVEGYAERQSYVAGDEAIVCCSSRVPSFSAEVARIGASRDVVWTRAGIAGEEQPVPPDAFALGCGWHETFRFPIPSDW